jgi:hypothetical protein
MAFNWNAAWKVAQAVFGIGDSSSRALRTADPARASAVTDIEAPGGGLLGHVEARLAGVMVSALKEAFDRDAARLAAEREAREDERRRAAEALRLELVRQSAERALVRQRAIGLVALAIWIVSVLFAMRLPEGFAAAGRLVLASGWAALFAAMGCAFAAQGNVSRWVAAAQSTRATAAEVPESGVAAAAPWLALAGLALVATSLLLAL